MGVNTKHLKVSGKSTGQNVDFKREGYAGTRVPPSMVSTKPGHTNHKPYSGPEVARGTHNG